MIIGKKTLLAFVVGAFILATLVAIWHILSEYRVPWGIDTPLLRAIKCAYYSCVAGCNHEEIEKIGTWEHPDGGEYDCKSFCGDMNIEICEELDEEERIRIKINPVHEKDELLADKNENTIFSKQWETIVEKVLSTDKFGEILLVRSGDFPLYTYAKKCEPYGFSETAPIALPTSSIVFPEEESICKRSSVFWGLIPYGKFKHCDLSPGKYQIWVDKSEDGWMEVEDNYDVIICPIEE